MIDTKGSRGVDMRLGAAAVSALVPAMKPIEVLYFDGCPAWRRAVDLVRQVLSEAGESDVGLRLVRVETEDDAVRQHFLGSPSIRVDGRDVDPAGAEPGAFGLQCRLYHDGRRFSDLPPAAWIRSALGFKPHPAETARANSADAGGGESCR